VTKSRLLSFAICLTISSMVLAGRCVAAERSDKPASAAPPAWIKPAFEGGRTEIEFYDPEKQAQEFAGWTIYDFQLHHRFLYEYKVRPVKNTYAVTIVPQFTEIEMPMRHRIRLPMKFDTPLVWDSSLAKHELEHVAIGAHPRVRKLTEHMLKKIQRVQRIVDKPSQLTEEWFEKAISEEIAPRRDAIDALITANNRQLDLLTGHGVRRLKDHDAFFSQMYLKENLDEMRFPYLSQTLDLLEQFDYQSARWDLSSVRSDK